MATLIEGANVLRGKLRKLGDNLLPSLEAPVAAVRDSIAASAAASVPVEAGDLAASAFSDGPEPNPKAFSVTATTGYTDDKAPAVHEGFHGNRRTTPPKWLERAAQGREAVLSRQVGSALWGALSKLVR